MKKAIITAIAALFGATLLLAQSNPANVRLTPEQKAQRSAVNMAGKLLLSDKDSEAFVKVYSAFKLENHAIQVKYRSDRKAKPAEGVAPAPKTDKEIEEGLRRDFEKSQAILDLRKAYLDKFLQVLSPRQVREMYKLERQSAERARARKADNGHHGAHPGHQPKAEVK